MVNHWDPTMDLRWGIILVQAFALVQRNADRSISQEHVTVGVLVSRRRRGPSFLNLKGMTLQWDLYSTRERDLLPGLAWWVLCKVMRSHTLVMASSFPAALDLVASPSLMSS
jgi:hypothetical protein